MKIFHILSIILLFSLLCSCSKKSDQPININGNWNLTQEEVKTYFNDSLSSDSVYNSSNSRWASINFKSDNTFISNSNQYITVNGQQYMIASGDKSGNYSLTINSLSFSGSIAGFGLGVIYGSATLNQIVINSRSTQLLPSTSNKFQFIDDVYATYYFQYDVPLKVHTISHYTYNR